jgi:hypothetical protein
MNRGLPVGFSRPKGRAFHLRQKKPVFVVNKALNFHRGIFVEFYRKRRNSGIAILNDFRHLQKI